MPAPVVYFNQKLRKGVNKMTTKYHNLLEKITHKLNALDELRESAYDNLYALEVAEPYDDEAFEEMNETCAEYDRQFNDLANLVERLTVVVDALNALHTEYREDELEELGK